MHKPIIAALWLVFFGIFSSVAASPSFAQQETLTQIECKTIGLDSFSYWQDIYDEPANAFVRYEARNRRLILVDNQTGDMIREIETSLDLHRFRDVQWSPGCRYLLAQADHDTVVWDLNRNVRLHTQNEIFYKNVYWHPNGERLLLETNRGTYLWHLANNSPILLTFTGDGVNRSFRSPYFKWQVEWDDSSNQVLIVPQYAGKGVVIAYHQETGEQLAFFHNNKAVTPVKFAFSESKSHIIVFSSGEETYNFNYRGATIWDRATGSSLTLSLGTLAPTLSSQIALSPNGRYLAVGRHDVLRVWDLQALPEISYESVPTYKLVFSDRTSNILKVRFTDDDTVETTHFDNTIWHWDFQTGELVSL